MSGEEGGTGRAPPEREGFLADDWSEARPGPAPQDSGGRRPRRRSPFAVSPLVGALCLTAIAWLLWDMWPDVSYFLSPREPIELGAPGSYHLSQALPNRFCRIAGVPVATVKGIESRGGAERRVVGLMGVNLVIDRSGGAGPAAVYEGRLLPLRAARDYVPFVAALRQRGWSGGERFWVLRDGERPGSRWGRPLLSVVLVLLGAVNLRALARAFLR